MAAGGGCVPSHTQTSFLECDSKPEAPSQTQKRAVPHANVKYPLILTHPVPHAKAAVVIAVAVVGGYRERFRSELPPPTVWRGMYILLMNRRVQPSILTTVTPKL